jgi:hypothetical protein
MIPREILKKIRQIELRTNRIVKVSASTCLRRVVAGSSHCLNLTTFQLAKPSRSFKDVKSRKSGINYCETVAFDGSPMLFYTFADDIYRNADSANNLADDCNRFADDHDNLADDCDRRANDRNKVADGSDKLANDHVALAESRDRRADGRDTFGNDRNRFAGDRDNRADNGDRLADDADKFAGGRDQLADAPAFLAANRNRSRRRQIHFSTP